MTHPVLSLPVRDQLDLIDAIAASPAFRDLRAAQWLHDACDDAREEMREDDADADDPHFSGPMGAPAGYGRAVL